jgi:hypothetical protein
MVLQYVVASFHLPSVISANISTVQYPKPKRQYEIQTIPAVVIRIQDAASSVQHLGAFFLTHSSHLFDISSGLPTIIIHNITPFTTIRLIVVAAAFLSIAVLVVVIFVLLLLLSTISNLFLKA